MAYLITAKLAGRAVSERRDTRIEALKRALEMIGEGMESVLITDPQGKQYSHNEFPKLYFEGRD